jgi:hypothetical protein
MFTQFPKELWERVTVSRHELASQDANNSQRADVPDVGAAKKPYKRRMTDKRREQNRAAQKAWSMWHVLPKISFLLMTFSGEKQKKELDELKALRDAELEKANPPPAPLDLDDELSADNWTPPSLGDSGTDGLALASMKHWEAIVNDDRARTANFCAHDHPQGNVMEIIEGSLPMNDDELLDAWAHVEYTEAPPVWPQGMGFPTNSRVDGQADLGAVSAWSDSATSRSPETIILTSGETTASFGSYGLLNFLSQDPRSVMNGVPMAAAAARSPRFVAPEDNIILPLSRQIRIHSMSIHLACSANARLLGCTPEKAVRNNFASPFYRPPTGPLPFNIAINLATGDDAEDAAWYDRGQACGWKNIKKHLRPTDGQLVLPHNLWLDTLPFPTFRERFLRLHQNLNGSELANDLAFLGGMVCWGAGTQNETGTGASWDVKNWEVKPWFVRKWFSTGVLGDDEGEVWEQCIWWAQFRDKEDGDDELDDLMTLLR